MLPDPREPRPLVLPDGTRHRGTVFLRAVIAHPNIEVGEYTYAHDATEPADFARQLAPYLFPGAPERLRIGKFCQIAEGVRFVTATANHPMDGLSTYPFPVFDPSRFMAYRGALPPGSDTVVGHDCWLGRDALILPGAVIGNGVIVGARAVVGGEVPDYAVVAGNRASVVKMRFGADEVRTLNRLAWWDWPIARIEAALPILEQGDVAALKRFHDEGGIEP